MGLFFYKKEEVKNAETKELYRKSDWFKVVKDKICNGYLLDIALVTKVPDPNSNIARLWGTKDEIVDAIGIFYDWKSGNMEVGNDVIANMLSANISQNKCFMEALTEDLQAFSDEYNIGIKFELKLNYLPIYFIEGTMKNPFYS